MLTDTNTGWKISGMKNTCIRCYASKNLPVKSKQ